jgi:hypothetical protein
MLLARVSIIGAVREVELRRKGPAAPVTDEKQDRAMKEQDTILQSIQAKKAASKKKRSMLKGKKLESGVD